MKFNLLIAGVGGQGTVLASKLVSAAALKLGFDVRTTETIGMAQRGGSVVSHVRIGDCMYSPLLPLHSADAMIAFEPAEAARQLQYLNREGKLLLCSSPVFPAGSAGYDKASIMEYLKAEFPQLIELPGSSLIGENAKTLNVALLGAAAECGIFPFDGKIIKEIIPEIIREKFIEMNINAFEKGKGAYREHTVKN